jgi:hypothetical protein
MHDPGDPPLDVSRVFWPFVHDVARMDYDDLVCTYGYDLLTEACNCGQRLSLVESEVIPSDALTVGGWPLADTAAVHGIDWDGQTRTYILEDCNALFVGVMELLKAYCHIHQHDLASRHRLATLSRCTDRMLSVISLSHLTERLQSTEIADSR